MFDANKYYMEVFKEKRPEHGVWSAKAMAKDAVVKRFFEEMDKTINPFKKIKLIIDMLRYMQYNDHT